VPRFERIRIAEPLLRRNELQWRELLSACPRPFHTATQDCLGEPLHRIEGDVSKIPDYGRFSFVYLENPSFALSLTPRNLAEFPDLGEEVAL
jgi:hypothetical protein